MKRYSVSDDGTTVFGDFSQYEEDWIDEHQDDEMAEPLYQVHWMAQLTGATGHGTGKFPKEEAQRYADELKDDKDNKALKITFWIEQAQE